MVSLISTLSFNFSSSSSSSSYVKFTKPTMNSLTSCYCSPKSLTFHLKTLNSPLLMGFSHVGLSQFAPFHGLKHLGVKISPKVSIFGRRGRCKGKVVHASLFGVGAPEALVIGVVALLVFGPKGLAEVARNLGKTLRAFQPTIRELQEVSREFKNTLEREISLDDDISSTSSTYGSDRANTLNQSVSSTENPQTSVADPNGTASSNAYSSEEYLKITEEQVKAYSATQENVATSSPPEIQTEIGSQSQDGNARNDAYSGENNLKDNSATSLLESQAEMKSQLQDTIQETAVTTPSPPVEKPETET